MNPKRIAIFYETSEGHTAAVARRVQSRLEQTGHAVTLARCRDALATDIEVADVLLVGGSIHAGSHHSKVLDFARTHVQSLNGKPAAFFLVCLTAHSSQPEAASTIAGYLETLTWKTGWKPRLSRVFAGALLYTQYSLVKRKIMESINRKEGGDTDTTRDFVYTDWQEVEAFADEVARL